MKVLLQFCFCMVFVFQAQCVPLKYELIDLPIEPSRINNKGEVAGGYHKWNPETGLIKLESDEEIERQAISFSGFNEVGQVVGKTILPTEYKGPLGGYMWEPDGAIKNLKDLTKVNFNPYGINDLGDIYGKVYQKSGFLTYNKIPSVYTHLGELFVLDLNEFGYENLKVWEVDGYISAMNNQGNMVGTMKVGYNPRDVPVLHYKTHAFIKYADGTLIELGEHIFPVDINERNQVLVTNRGGSIAALWQDGVWQELWTGGDCAAIPTAINNYGEVVGIKSDKAILWKDGQIFALENFIENNSGWILHRAFDINDQGQIGVAGYRVGKGFKTFLLTPVSSVQEQKEKTTLQTIN